MTTSRYRQQRQKTGRAPGILRGPAQAPAAERPAVEHGVRSQFGVSWRLFSGLIVVTLSIVLATFFMSDYFYVRSVKVHGVNYLDQAEVFRYAGVAEMHVFWVDPKEVRQSILADSPVVADARVVVSWPPDMVEVFIEEREPALVWTQSGVSALVDLQGRVLRYPPQEEARPDLLQVIAENAGEGPPGIDGPLPMDAINGALQLRTLLAGLQVLRYHPAKGLGFREPGGWDVWLGVGTNMPNKLLIYEELRANLQERGITPVEINVADPEAAYYCGSIEVCHE